MTPSGFSVVLNKKKKRKLLWMWEAEPSEIAPTVFEQQQFKLFVWCQALRLDGKREVAQLY